MTRLVQLSSIALTIAAVSALTACSTSPRTSAVPFLPGPAPTVYLGSVQDSVLGNGTLRLSLSTASGVTSGTWDATYNGRSRQTRIVDGTVANNEFTGTVRTQDGVVAAPDGCTCTMNATFSATDLSGSYAAVAITRTCPTLQSGSFTVARQ